MALWDNYPTSQYVYRAKIEGQTTLNDKDAWLLAVFPP
jgi:hypothetical protein